MNSRDVYALSYAPRFSTPSSSCSLERFVVPLKCKCSKKCALPDVSRVSFREPALTKIPTEEMGVGHDSEHTRIPLERVVISKGRSYLSGSGISPNSSSPKLFIIGALENCIADERGVTEASGTSLR